jgi:uncharacterized repeat protein (TIGR01451 family)
VCAVAAVVAGLAGVAVVASAQPVPVTPNPKLTAECGLRVMLVLDESASISAADVTRTREAANAFVSALKDTGSELAITSFALNARTLIGYNAVSDTTVPAFTSAINGFATGTGLNRNGTNWDAAFRLVRTFNATSPANLVVFMTDGNPNTYILANGNNATPQENTAGWTAATPASITAANSVKDQLSRIFAMGVGAAVSDPTSQQRLQWISGPSEFGTGAGQNSDFATSDWTRVTDFTALKAALTGIVARLCGSQLIITKQVLDHNGDPVDASGWTYTATLSPSGGHTWLAPDTAGTNASASLTTGSDGIADFQWRLHSASNTVTVGVTHERERNGFRFVEATCRNVGPDGPDLDTQVTSTTEIPGATLGEGDFRTCDVLNTEKTARLTVIKRLEPTDDPGKFDLLVNGVVRSPAGGVGNNGTTGPINLPLGTHTVSETPVAPTSLADYSTSIECVDVARDAHVVVPETPGPGPVSVPLTSQHQNIVCTITNVSTKFGELTVIKHLIPDTDRGRFNLLVSGTTAGEKANAGDGDRLDLTRIPFGPYDVTESAVAPTNLANYDITTVCTDGDGGTTIAENPSGPSVSFALSRTDNNIVCIIQNKRSNVPVAHLTVVKNLVPSGDAGAFDLLIGGDVWAPAVGDGGSTGRLAFELGKYTVTERGADGTDLADFSISTTCVNKAGRTVAQNAHGPSVSVNLRRESADIVCTITNTRTQAPGGGGEIPDTPGPYLGVVKEMPADARVGQEVRFTITVHNLGHGTAKGVQLHETPPHGMQLVSVGNHGTIQHGTAVWHLGNLAPGASRTVHGKVRITHTGMHVNTAVATALNANPALSDAAVRARAAAHPPTPPPPPPPAVTG